MSESVRAPRADGLRNRERLLAVARAAVAAGEIDVALDEIARRAGVGIGTLYRHFPTRAALLEALYRDEVDGLCQLSAALLGDAPPVEALRAWLLAFVDVLSTKRSLVAALDALRPAGGAAVSSGDRLKAAVTQMVREAQAADEIADDIDPVDLLRALSGVVSVASGAGAVARAKRMVEVLIAGAQPRRQG